MLDLGIQSSGYRLSKVECRRKTYMPTLTEPMKLQIMGLRLLETSTYGS